MVNSIMQSLLNPLLSALDSRIQVKGSMTFLFDFGEGWNFSIKLEHIDSDYKFGDTPA